MFTISGMQINEIYFPSIVSTNAWAKEHLRTFDREAMTVISADEQTQGRGSYGKKWLSPPGINLYTSFAFFIHEGQKNPLVLTHVLAISTVRVLEKWGVQGRIKWPNDIMVARRKIAGILCETLHLPPHFGVVIGIGVNVNAEEVFLAGVGQPATSLFVEKGVRIDRSEVLETLKGAFSTDLALFLQEGFDPLMPDFRRLILGKS